MGVVFSARDQALRRRVAIKVLHSSERVMERVFREARTCAQLQSNHVVQIFDVGYLPDGVPFLVMEHLVGEDLGALVGRGPLDIATAVEYLLQTCNAVGQQLPFGPSRDLEAGV
jgi:serine/threonine protein kinase